MIEGDATEKLTKLYVWIIEEEDPDDEWSGGIGDTITLYRSVPASPFYGGNSSYFLAFNDDTKINRELGVAWAFTELFAPNIVCDNLSRVHRVEFPLELIRPIVEQANTMVCLYL